MKPAPSWHLWTKKHGSYVKLTAQINKKLLRRKLVAGSFSWKKMRTENHHQVLGDSKKVTTHPDIAHPFGNPPIFNYERIPWKQPVGKGFFGVCSSSVCWNNLRGIRFCQATIQILLSLLMSFRNIAPISSKKRGGRKQRQSNGVRKGKICVQWKKLALRETKNKFTPENR